jgi:hypothetical protein
MPRTHRARTLAGIVLLVVGLAALLLQLAPRADAGGAPTTGDDRIAPAALVTTSDEVR